ncbi:MAG: hypothetical protein OQL16_07165, partial [Gammaproteobacteria bacterium]|nr:hypothetical protein [Gammaproteobacteria bacterium]
KCPDGSAPQSDGTCLSVDKPTAGYQNIQMNGKYASMPSGVMLDSMRSQQSHMDDWFVSISFS